MTGDSSFQVLWLPRVRDALKNMSRKASPLVRQQLAEILRVFDASLALYSPPVHDHEQVHVAVRSRVAARLRAEEDDLLGVRASALQTAHILRERLISSRGEPYDSTGT